MATMISERVECRCGAAQRGRACDCPPCDISRRTEWAEGTRHWIAEDTMSSASQVEVVEEWERIAQRKRRPGASPYS